MSNIKQSFAKSVWETLSKVNVNNHTEKKQNLTYLSWAWAWGTLMEYYPESEYEILPETTLANNTVECWVSLTIKEGDNSVTRKMWLPVMDFKNKAMPNPDSVMINKTRMRCLAKAIAMFGLGHYIYAGEDLPSEDDKQQPAQQAKPQQAKPAYSQADFDSNKQGWQEAIQAGKTTAENMINKISTQFTLNPQQIQELRGMK